jgi:hypothetical protein
MKAVGAAAEVQVAAHSQAHPAAADIRAEARSTAGVGNLQKHLRPHGPGCVPGGHAAQAANVRVPTSKAMRLAMRAYIKSPDPRFQTDVRISSRQN